MVGAARAERGEARVLDAREEVKDLRRVGEVADLRPVGGDQTTNGRGEGGPFHKSFSRRERAEPAELGAEGLGL